MNPTTFNLTRLFLFLGLLGSGILPAQTVIKEFIVQNAQWDTTHAPYIIEGDVRLIQGKTLTIKPGVEVQFANDSSKLIVRGSLQAIGTRQDSILFHHRRTVPGGGIVFSEGSTNNRMEFIRFEDMGNARMPGLKIETKAVQINQSSFKNFRELGVSVDKDIQPKLYKNNFAGIPIAIYANANSFKNIYENDLDHLLLASDSIHSEVTIPLQTASAVYDLEGDLYIGQTGKLICKAGTRFAFTESSQSISISGSLVLQGSKSDSIYVESQVNTYDNHIIFDASSIGSSLEYVHISGLGKKEEDALGGIVVQSDSLRIQFCHISQSISPAIDIQENRRPVIKHSQFSSNVMDIRTNPIGVERISFNGLKRIGILEQPIQEEITWPGIAEDAHYELLGRLSVQTRAKLTLSPGVNIYFGPKSRNLNIDGTLIAKGNLSRPIRFVGKNTNAVIEMGSRAEETILEHVSIENLGTLEHPALSIHSSAVSLKQSYVRNALGIGLHIRYPATPTIEGNTFSDNQKDIRSHIEGMKSYKDNTLNQVVLSEDRVMNNSQLPNLNRDAVYEIEKQVIVSQGTQLRIEAGTKIRFSKAQAALLIEGILKSQGTERDPISFIGDTEKPMGGVVILQGSEGSEVSYNRFQGLRTGFEGRYAGVHLASSSLSFKNNVIEHCAQNGMQILRSAVPRLRNNTFNANEKDIFSHPMSLSRLSTNSLSTVHISGGAIEDSSYWPSSEKALVYSFEGNVTVLKGGQLTIGPGAELRFPENFPFEMLVEGSLKAIGSPDRPILFSGNIASSSSIIFDQGSVASEIAFGKFSRMGNEKKRYGAAIETHSSNLHIKNSTFTECKPFALHVDKNIVPTLLDNTFASNGRDIYLFPEEGDILKGNRLSTVVIAGGKVGNTALWPNLGEETLYEMDSEVTIANLGKLTWEKGITVSFRTRFTDILVEGTLEALGTADIPILLKGISKGGENALIFDAKSKNSRLEHVNIEGLGRDDKENNSGVYAGTSSLEIVNCIIGGSPNYGLYVASHASPSLRHTRFTNNYRDIYAYPAFCKDISSNSFQHIVLSKGPINELVQWSSLEPNVKFELTGDVNVSEKGSLTVAAGSHIFFTKEARRLMISGVLDVQGTANSPVLFDGESQKVGTALEFYASAKANIAYGRFRGMGGFDKLTQAAIYTQSPNLNLVHTQIDSCKKYGLYVDGSFMPTLTNCSFQDNLRDIYAHPEAIGTLSTVTLRNVVLAKGNISKSATWPNLGSDVNIELLDDVIVDPNGELNIEPGVKVLFSPAKRNTLLVQGNLVANGTAQSPIRFESKFKTSNAFYGKLDKAYGGAIRFKENTSASLQYIVFSRLGHAQNESSGILVENAALSLKNSTILNCAKYGMTIAGESSSTVIEANTFQKNSSFGIRLGDGSQAKIKNNAFEGNDLFAHSNSLQYVTDNKVNTIFVGKAPVIQEVTWPLQKGNTSYRLTGPLIIEEKGLVTLEPSTRILLPEAEHILTIHGGLKAMGNAKDSIYFVGSGGGAIHLKSNQTESEFQYISTDGLGKNALDASILSESGNVQILNSRIGGSNSHGLVIMGPSDNVRVESCVFSNNFKNGLFIPNGGVPNVIANNLAGDEILIHPQSASRFQDNQVQQIEILDRPIRVRSRWPKQKGPTTYSLQGNLTIPQEKELNIDPGVILAFQRPSGKVLISGTFRAIGTERDSIHIGRQGGSLEFSNDRSLSELAFVSMRQGQNAPQKSIFVNNGNLRMSQSFVSNHSGHAIAFQGQGPKTQVQNNVFVGKKSPTIRLFEGGGPKIEENKILGEGILSHPMSLSQFRDNEVERIVLSAEEISKTAAWPKQRTNSHYWLDKSLTIAKTGQLSISPGIAVHFADASVNLNVFGKLTAKGSRQDSIFFKRPSKDRSHGGGTLSFEPGSQGELEFVGISQLGDMRSKYHTAVYVRSSSVDISRSFISQGEKYGIFIEDEAKPSIRSTVLSGFKHAIFIYSGQPELVNVDFYGNALAIDNQGSSDIKASGLYWGSPTGPRHDEKNLAGKGNKIIGKVNFEPWAKSSTIGNAVNLSDTIVESNPEIARKSNGQPRGGIPKLVVPSKSLKVVPDASKVTVQYLMIKNDGDGTLLIKSIADNSKYLSINIENQQIAEGETKKFPVKVSSSTPNPFSGKIRIISNDPDQPTLMINVDR